jgi:hypothetical protein
MTARDQLIAKIEAQVAIDCHAPPVVGLDEYFLDNADEDCIAPNQIGQGRPALGDIYSRFRQIQQRSDVQAVLVGIHADWVEAKSSGVWPAAENIHIYTTAGPEIVAEWLSGLESDGTIEGWTYGMHTSAPKVKSGFKVYTVCWD